jgi:hypothetical protein
VVEARIKSTGSRANYTKAAAIQLPPAQLQSASLQYACS